MSGCDIGVSYTLPRLIGAARAAELIYTGRHFGAEEAEHSGFVSEVVAIGAAGPGVAEGGGAVVAQPFALEVTKQVLRANQDASSVDAAIALENRAQILAGSGDEFVEAVAARREGRSPRWAAKRE